ncbi:imidazolonepropionase [uncultured Ferrimonas sp.]|uniref:imidazolonepropionase n=1 Tax=uncultured Ferrimonas sp. TaxID=432640 RepID=UPI00261DD2EB|nr:imidazolonepropionase [uncultured Ferrimonas sp.]
MNRAAPVRWDRLIRNVHLATFEPAQHGSQDPQFDPDYGVVRDGAIAIAGGRIAWLGAEAQLPPNASAAEEVDGQGQWLLPGLIDCHTHLVFGGNRAEEFEQRLQGVSYADIARAGGGINSTVRATRATGVDALVAQARPRLQALLAEGVTGIEIKSGYGLDLASERQMLQAASRLGAEFGIKLQRTFLGAHALPPQYQDNADGYVDELCQTMLPSLAAEGLVDAVDGFCESIAFSTAQMERVFACANALGLPVKLHAEQLTNQGGAALVARHGGLSADHLEYLDAAGIAAMAAAGTTAVLLPGAYYFLRETKQPPLQALQQAGVPIALASDANPGSSPLFSLQLMLNFACTLWGMTPAQALTAVTRNGALALGWQDHCGTLARGKRADLVLWPLQTPAELAYQFGGIRPSQIWIEGQPQQVQS